MSFNEREAAEWTQGVEAENAKLLNVVQKSLADGAARGFPEPPGENLEDILMASQEAKDKLVQVNGKIYEDRRAIIFSEYEFALKIMTKVMALAMELYRQQIFNALEIEQSEVQAAYRRSEADVKRLNSETEKRQVAIIRDRATAQNQIAVLKEQLVQAQENTLPYESALVAAQLETAEMQLQIIQSIWQIIAAQKVELVADQRKLVALQNLLAAEQILLAVKQAMVPYYIEKAQAEENLATATIDNIPIQEALIKLGYGRLDLETATQYVAHLLRAAEENVNLATATYTQVKEANWLTRIQNEETLAQYKNTIQSEILGKKLTLEEEEALYMLNLHLARETITVDNEVTLENYERTNLTEQLTSLLDTMKKECTAHVAEIIASATQTHRSTTEFKLQRLIESGTTLAP